MIAMTMPAVNLEWDVHWCGRHLEPFREDWPGGAGVAMVRLFEAAMGDERIQERGANIPAGALTEGLDALLREHSPLCCFVGDERMRPIYRELGKEPPS